MYIKSNRICYKQIEEKLFINITMCLITHSRYDVIQNSPIYTYWGLKLWFVSGEHVPIYKCNIQTYLIFYEKIFWHDFISDSRTF